MAAIESATPATAAASAAPVTTERNEGEQLTVTYTQTLSVSASPLEKLGTTAPAQPSIGEVFTKALTSALTAVEKALTKFTEIISKLVDEVKKLVAKLAEAKPAETKPAETKPGETKPAETKPSETMPPETKPSETKPPETKPTETTPANNGPLTPGTLSFTDKVKTVLKPDKDGRVSETELRRGVVVYQLYQKDTKTADRFEALYDQFRKADETPGESLKMALAKLIDEGKLQKWEANWVYSLSHRAAQFEGEDTALSTSTTAPHGKVLADAIKSAEMALVGIQTGKIEVKPLTI